MNKPDIPPMMPGSPLTQPQQATNPSALVRQVGPVDSASEQPLILPTRPASPAKTIEYVDPYLFETGYYASQAEYEALSHTAITRIQLRAEVENAPIKRRLRRSAQK
jgi:tripartite-type tricarboxylate transporter receptor subunit TctC